VLIDNPEAVDAFAQAYVSERKRLRAAGEDRERVLRP
jgi:hypothetical protein